MLFLFSVTMVPGSALAGDLYIFPNDGQSEERMAQDKGVCYEWAKKQTGFDPMKQPTATAPPPSSTRSTTSPLRGAFRGAATGAVIGGIANDDAGKGAAIGAASGALIGGMRRRDHYRRQQQQQQWAQQQAAEYQYRRNEYNRAYGACLEGKGYTVK